MKGRTLRMELTKKTREEGTKYASRAFAVESVYKL